MPRFECPSCKVTLEADETITGRSFTCPKCGVNQDISPKSHEPERAALQPVDDVDIDRGMTISRYMSQRGIEGGRELTGETPTTTATDLLQTEKGKKYVIGDMVAKGGMGGILRVRDLNIRRQIAMKVMLDSKKATNEDILRFIEEAQVTGQLEHPNITPVHELGVDSSGNVFFTMKMIKGRSLKEILRDIRKGKKQTVEDFPLNRLLNVFVKVCDAIAYAHSKGVIHRDLKPENIMVGEFGEVLVIDWGIAHLLRDSEESETPEKKEKTDKKGELPSWVTEDIESVRRDDASHRTMVGDIVGTPHFMAPEQAYGYVDQIDERTDIYALGGILYNILSLRKPVEGKIVNEVLMKVINGDITSPVTYNTVVKAGGRQLADAKVIRLRHCRDGVIPEALSAVVMKAMAVEQDERYQSVSEFQGDIEAYISGFATSAEEAGFWRQVKLLIRRRKREFILICTAAALLVVFLTSFLVRLAFSERKARRNMELALKKEEEASKNLKMAEASLAELKATAPVFLRQAEAFMENHEFDRALAMVDNAIRLSPKNGEFHALRGNILQSLLQLEPAIEAYQTSLKHRPRDMTVFKNLSLCKRILKDNKGRDGNLLPESLYALQKAMLAQGRVAEATNMLRAFRGKKAQTLADWQSIINKSGIKASITQGTDGMFNVLVEKTADELTGFQNFKELPIRTLDMSETRVVNLRPLAGLQIWHLNLSKTKVSDLTPLKGMPLKTIGLSGCYSLQTLDGLQNAKLEKLDLATCTNLRNLNGLQGNLITELRLPNHRSLVDISALRGTPLKKLNLAHPYSTTYKSNIQLRNTSLTTLDGLQDTKLEWLSISNCNGIKDLKPLRGLPLKYVDLRYCSVLETLDGLQNAKLKFLDLATCYGLKDLNGLQGNLIEDLNLSNHRKLEDISALRKTPLKKLNLLHNYHPYPHENAKRQNIALKSLNGLQGTKLEWLSISNCNGFKDLKPLRGLPLKEIDLRYCTALTSLNGLQNAKLKKLDLSSCYGLKSLDGLQGNLIESLNLKNHRQLEDISALKGTPLKRLDIYHTHSTNWRANEKLKNTTLKSLKGLEGTRLEWLSLHNCIAVKDLKPLRGLPLKHVNIRFCSSLTSLDGLQNAKLKALDLSTCMGLKTLEGLQGNLVETLELSNHRNLEDISALKKTPLKKLNLLHRYGSSHNSKTQNTALKSLDGLQGTKLEWLSISNCNGLKDLKPLRGLPLKHVDVRYCNALETLDGLQNAKLKALDLTTCYNLKTLEGLQGNLVEYLNLAAHRKLADISALKNVPIKKLDLSMGVSSSSIYANRLLKSLDGLQGTKLEWLSINGCWNLEDLKPLSGLPLKYIDMRYCKSVPSLDGLQKSKLTYFNAGACFKLADISALAGKKMTLCDISSNSLLDSADLDSMKTASADSFSAYGCPKIRDISALKTIRPKRLNIARTAADDLSPLTGGRLEHIDLSYCPARDLAQLRGNPLTSIHFNYTGITNLAPLKGMKIKSLGASYTPLKDLKPLTGMPLTYLNVSYSKVADLSPIGNSQITSLHFAAAQVKDLTPIRNLKLTSVGLSPMSITKGLEIVRDMKTVLKIGSPKRGATHPAHFWRWYDAQKKPKKK